MNVGNKHSTVNNVCDFITNRNQIFSKCIPVIADIINKTLLITVALWNYSSYQTYCSTLLLMD